MNENNYIGEDEITLKELILKIQEFWRELLRNWLLIGLISLPFALWFLYDAYTTPTKYKADLVFMINEEKGGSGGGVASIASQLGLSVGGNGGEYNKEKIISLSKSGKIILPVILDSLEVKGVTDLIGNHIVRLYRLHENWESSKNEKLKTFLFTTNNIDSFTVVDNLVLQYCHKLIIGATGLPALSSCNFDEDSGILSITSQTISEELAYGLTNKIFNTLSVFYIKQQIEPQQKSFEAIKIKADSLSSIVRNKEYELANLIDGTRSVYLQQYKLQEERLKRELPIYASQYAALLQNVENADFLLKNKTPFFQVIDYPFYPLSVVGANMFRSLLMGGFLGVFLAVLFVIGRKIIRDTLS